MKLLIAGDTLPDYDLIKIDNEIIKIIEKSDHFICNLEGPICDRGVKIKKTGPHMNLKTKNLINIKKLNIDTLCLANNHIMDYGKDGLDSTINNLKENDIKFFGAGDNKEQSYEPIIYDKNGLRVVVLCFAENEFSTTQGNKPGAAPYDPLCVFDLVEKYKVNSDHVIVIFHAGKELFPYPTPNLQKICRKFIEKGASLVTCQHSHIVGAIESYLEGKIYYGQGNFILPNYNKSSGILIEILLSKDKCISNYHHVSCNFNSLSIPNDKKNIDYELRKRSEILKNNDIETLFNTYIKESRRYYLESVLLFNNFEKIINRISCGLYLKFTLRNINKLKLGNLIDCETHREILVKILKYE